MAAAASPPSLLSRMDAAVAALPPTLLRGIAASLPEAAGTAVTTSLLPPGLHSGLLGRSLGRATNSRAPRTRENCFIADGTLTSFRLAVLPVHPLPYRTAF